MKTTVLIVATIVALSAAAIGHAASARSTRQLSDARVGSTKPELIAQRDYSQAQVDRLAGTWKVAPRHSTCWSHVPWSKVCDHARRKLLAHRWLHEVATRRLARLYPPPFVIPAAFLDAATCVHRYEGAWNDDTGNGFGGGLQFMVGTWNRAAKLSGGSVPYVGSTGEIAKQTPRTQIHAAYLIVQSDRGSWREWPNTARACGLL